MDMVWKQSNDWDIIEGKILILQIKMTSMIDTIPKPMKLQLHSSVENMSIVIDSNTGVKSYQITLDSPKPSNPLSLHREIWFVGLLVMLLAAVVWTLSRRKFKGENPSKAKESAQENALRNDLLCQSEAYKRFACKGFFMVRKNASVEAVKEQEINDLCYAVADVFSAFSEWLYTKGLSDRDFQFCCLMKSGLSTFELSEIYCISESAIFKRKQKLKEKLGLKADKRTLDVILQEM